MTRHRFDPLSFIFGVLFVVVAAVGLVDRELLTVTDLRWIAPGLLVAAGALLLVLSGRRTGSERSAGADMSDGADGAEDRGDARSNDDDGGHGVADVESDPVTAAARSPRDETAVEGDAPER